MKLKKVAISRNVIKFYIFFDNKKRNLRFIIKENLKVLIENKRLILFINNIYLFF